MRNVLYNNVWGMFGDEERRQRVLQSGFGCEKHLVISELVSNFASLLSAVKYAKTMSNPLGKRWLRCV